jgi:uncharacterized protein YndB with AHSA1/START domain
MTPNEGLWLRMTRVLPAGREEVWRAMTDPGMVPEWFGPKGFSSPGVEFEPRVGETFRIAMQPPDGDPFHLDGEFREVETPSRLSYTFVWDPPDPDDRETVVTLSLDEGGPETEVTFAQGEFATAERLELHREGWTDSFDRLEELLG